MKRTLWLAALAALILSLPAWGQEIRVTSPTAGVRWCIGSSYTVTWTKSGAMDARVSIRLRLRGGGDSGVVTMSDRTENDGSFGPWEVPAGTAPGEYLVRIRTIDGAVTGSSENFDVAACAEPAAPVASITVTRPDASCRWQAGSRQTIEWTKSGDLNPTASITLRREGAPESETAAARIADGCANNGSRTWPIPATLAPARYFVRVQAGPVQDDSAAFAVTAAATAPVPTTTAAAAYTRPPIRFRVNQPRGGDVVEVGTRVPIAWQSPSPDSGENAGYTFTVKAVRQSDHREFTVLENYYVNPGEGATHSWNVDRRIYQGYPGDYRIRVIGYTGLAAESGVFRLNTRGSEDHPPDSITVFRPRNTEELLIGANATVEWRTPPADSGAEYGSQIKITAQRLSDRRQVVIAESCPNQPGLNYFRWSIDPARFRSYPGDYQLLFECRSAHRSSYTNDYYTLHDESSIFSLRNGDAIPYSEEKLEDLAIEVVADSVRVSEVFGDNPGPGLDKYRVRCDLSVVNLARDASGRPRPEINHARCQWILEAQNSGMLPFPDVSIHYFELGPIRAEATTHPVDISFLVRDDRVDENTRLRIRFVIDPIGQLEDYSREKNRNNTAYSPWFHPRN